MNNWRVDFPSLVVVIGAPYPGGWGRSGERARSARAAACRRALSRRSAMDEDLQRAREARPSGDPKRPAAAAYCG